MLADFRRRKKGIVRSTAFAFELTGQRKKNASISYSTLTVYDGHSD